MISRRGFAFVVAAVAVVVATVIAVADLLRTEDRVPAVPALCAPTAAACEAERAESLRERLEEVDSLENAYRLRAWAYGIAAAGAVVAAVAVALRGRPGPAARRQVFADLGVLGVCLLVGAVLLVYLGERRYLTVTAPLLRSSSRASSPWRRPA